MTPYKCRVKYVLPKTTGFGRLLFLVPMNIHNQKNTKSNNEIYPVYGISGTRQPFIMLEAVCWSEDPRQWNLLILYCAKPLVKDENFERISPSRIHVI